MLKELKVFEGRSKVFWVMTQIGLIGILGYIDYQTGNEFSFSLFYLIPISLTAWYASRSLWVFSSILGTIMWLLDDIHTVEDSLHPIIYFWNTVMRFGFFIIVAYVISELHKTQRTIQILAHTDYLTGTINSRYFQELLGIELNRSNRYKRPFTLVYLDLDNFKQVNDRFGHDEGDQLITFIAAEIKCQIRTTDYISRQGGDEFAILFPETGQEEAKVVMSKIYSHLTEQLRQKYSFVAFSAGAVTFIAAPDSIKEIIKTADDLMYSVKNSTKNGVRYSLYTG